MEAAEIPSTIETELNDIPTAEELFRRVADREAAVLEHNPLKKGSCGDPIMNS